MAALDQAVVANEAIEHDDSWAEGLPVVTRPLLTKDLFLEHHIRLNGLPRLDSVFDRLIAHPGYLPYLEEFMHEPQLINTWSISKYPGRGATHWPPRSASRGLLSARRQDSLPMLNVGHHAHPQPTRATAASR